MNCEAIGTILDTHGSARLTTAERTAVDTHLVTCGDCAAAWRAQNELAELPLPPVPAALLDRALRAARVQPTVPPRRSRATFIVASALLAGAALAGIAVVSLTDPPSADTAAAPTSATPAAVTADVTAGPDTSAAASTPTDAAPPSDLGVAAEFINTSLQLVPFVRVNPDYPPEALTEKLEGRVIVELTVTATGEVEDAHVVESTDARFDASALSAVQQWKYLPRIVAGKRAATENMRTMLTFQLQPAPAESAIRRAYEPIGPGLPLDSKAFETTMLTAWQRVITDDLRGAELALDEFRATYALPAFTQGEVWNAYAYVYTLQANYDRAIDAYETAIAIFTQAGMTPGVTQGRWVELANLYFARNQYDMALNTLLRPRRASNDATRRMSPEAQALMEKLRALGITEETVPAN